MNKSRIADRTTTTCTTPTITTSSKSKTTTPTHPLVQLTRTGSNFSNSLDESDSSSLPEGSWSCSTAPTAIQQHNNNLSSNSLHLELNSSWNSTATHTPEQRTPGNNIQNNEEEEEAETEEQDLEYFPMTTAITRELRLDAENLDRQLFGEFVENQSYGIEYEYEKLSRDSLDLLEDLKENEIIKYPDVSELLKRRRSRQAKARSSIEPLETTTSPLKSINPFLDEAEHVLPIDDTITAFIPNSNSAGSLPEVLIPISTASINNSETPIEVATNAVDEPATTTVKLNAPILPAPTEFGGGNPFLMFLCLTLLLQHRNTIMKTGMDYNEIAMHFDKMVRKHDVTRVLNQARRMYIDYLKTQHAYRKQQQQQQQQLELNENN